MTLTDHLRQLIMERDTVILPGFGALETRYEPATFDYVQGKLHPPNKSLTFNANLRLNDGTLIRHVQQTENSDYAVAKTRVEDFVESLKTQLAAGETIHVPGIGKFFLDLNQKTHFLPEGQAQLYPATYGLPTIDAQPVQRTAASAAATAEAAAPTATQHPGTIVLRPSRSAGLANFFVRALPFLLVLAIALIGYTVYKIQDTDGEPYVRNVNQERINRKPGIPTENAEIPLTSESDYSDTEDLSDLDEVLPEATPPVRRRDTEASTLEPGRRADVIVVGTFGNPRYAERMLQRVSEDGYDAWSDRLPNGLRRIGINIAFSSDVEKRERLETMRDRYTRSAYLLSEKE